MGGEDISSGHWALLLLAVVVAGCRLDVATTLVVDPDGAGTAAIALTVDDDLRDRLEAAGVPVEGLVPIPDPDARWSVEPVAEPDATGVRLTTTFDDPEGLGDAFDALRAGLDADDGVLVEEVELTVGDDGSLLLTFTGGLLPPAVLGTAPVGAPGGGEELARRLRAGGGDLATATVAVTFPTVPVIVEGRGAVEGTTARLSLPVGAVSRVVVTAPPERLEPDEAVVAGSLGLVMAVVLVALVARRRRST